jgi:nickel transport protein
VTALVPATQRRASRLLPLLAALLTVSAAPALAHQTLHEVQRGKAVAVRASFVDGEVLAYAAYEVFSPADQRIPHQKGRTDRNGWLAFVPDSPGEWRVKVIDESGHGFDVLVDAEAQGGSAAQAAAPGAGAASDVAFVLRPLLGLAAIGAVFAVLILGYRKRGTSRKGSPP